MLNNQVFTSSRKSVSVHKWLWSPSHVSVCCLASEGELWELILAVKSSARNLPKLNECHQLTTSCQAQDAFLQEPRKGEFWKSKGVIFPFITPVTHTLWSTWHRYQGTSRTTPEIPNRPAFSILNSSLLKTSGFGAEKPDLMWPIATLKSAIPNNLCVAFESGQHHGKRADFHTILFPVNSSLQCTEVYSHYEIQLGLFCLRRSLSDHRQESGKGTHFIRLKLWTFSKLMCFEFGGLIIHKHATQNRFSPLPLLINPGNSMEKIIFY